MILHYDTENDKRLRTVAWLKEHINEFNDADKVLVLNSDNVTLATKIYNACPTEEELDLEDEIQLSAAKIAMSALNS